MAKYSANDDKIKSIVKKLKKWDDAYFNTSKPIVSDAEYDKYKLFLQKHVPNHPYLKIVGAAPKTGKKVKLPYYMPSLDKIYPDKGAIEFLKNSSGQFEVMDKLDGISLLEVKSKTNKLELFTRGNGSVGQDVSKLIPHIKSGRLSKSEAVRGELVISNSTFDSMLAEEYDNTRNLTSAIANSKEVHKAVKHADFIIHEYINPHIPWSRARVKLKSNGWNTVYTKKFKNPTVKELEAHLEQRRKASKYDIDGLVLIDSVTGSKISFKVNEPSKQAVVDKVVWTLSKNSVYKPVAHFKTPIKLKGASVSKATVHNARKVVDEKIGPGAIVELLRAGDVIPKIVGVIKPAKTITMPDNYKWNSTKTDIIATKLDKAEKYLVKAKQLTESFKIFGIDSVRMNVANQLVKNKFDLLDIFDASKEEFIEIGIGQADSTKLYNGIQKIKKSISHDKLMWASNIWPSGFTDTRFEKILSAIPYKKLIKTSDSKLIQGIGNIPGLSEATARIFVRHLKEYEAFVDELDFKPKTIVKVEGGTLSGMTFVFTKVRSKEIEAEIKKNGGTVSGSINKNTTGVITKSAMEGSTKITKARSLGIKIYTLNEFKKKFKL